MKCDNFLDHCKSVVRNISNLNVKNVSTYGSRHGKNVIVEVDNTGELFELIPTHLLDDNDKGFYKIFRHIVNTEQTEKFGSKIYDHKKCGYYHIDEDGFFKIKD